MRKQYMLHILEHAICREHGLKNQILRVVNIIFPTILERTCKIRRQMKTLKNHSHLPFLKLHSYRHYTEYFYI